MENNKGTLNTDNMWQLEHLRTILKLFKNIQIHPKIRRSDKIMSEFEVTRRFV